MLPNVGLLEQRVRYLLALVCFLAVAFLQLGVWEYVLGMVGTVLVGTAVLGYCPLWEVLHINTAKPPHRGLPS